MAISSSKSTHPRDALVLFIWSKRLLHRIRVLRGNARIGVVRSRMDGRTNMKAIQFTVTFTGEVPDDIDIEKLYLNLNLEDVSIGRAKTPDALGKDTYNLFEYETVDVCLLDDNSD
jgi:hypothetical protein